VVGVEVSRCSWWGVLNFEAILNVGQVGNDLLDRDVTGVDCLLVKHDLLNTFVVFWCDDTALRLICEVGPAADEAREDYKDRVKQLEHQYFS